MKRKIAAIFAADIAGYSRLVAEDEEETLRRLASYRQVTDDFIAKGGGRIFNTAGDAVLAEFPSAVEAVRCAIDIQESLRTRNMAYPPSRQMAFRIGITIGDVVERDGDLLGDGVNIAARLEGLAEVGGTRRDVALDAQPFEREAPMIVALERPGGSPGVAILAARPAGMLVEFDLEGVVTHGQQVPAPAFRDHRGL